ncbi:hypothetical protein CBR_g246 [Chara braunii]|uniref:Uncharacterized protein n=1 Tax=Chara braunii TaxID=69332 RepID=A0A388JM18_CHABU|nr:hypothetical protein CBR_g246 [Chara braunii]|eukprot:GBG58847.1 hypothetical protein CBR_g246 [Chara braunii]
MDDEGKDGDEGGASCVEDEVATKRLLVNGCDRLRTTKGRDEETGVFTLRLKSAMVGEGEEPGYANRVGGQTLREATGREDVGPTVVTGSPPATLSPPSPPLQLPTWPPPASPIGHLGNQSALRPYLSALLNKTSSLTPHPVPMIEAPSLSPQSGAGSEQGEDLVGSSLQPSFASGHDLQVGESQILLSQHSPILPGLIEGDIQGGKDSLQLSPSSSSSWGNRQDQVQVQGAAAAPSGAPTAGLEVQHGAYSNGTSAAPSGSSPEANPYGQIYYAPDLDRDNGALFNHPSVPLLFTPLLLYWTVLIRMSCDLYV